MTNLPAPPDIDFRKLSARLGQDPLQVQGPGGNTSIKDGVAETGVAMWIKASGTELANGEDPAIFVAVDRQAALAEAGGAGDGTCAATVLDPTNTMRPSIETTFHALFDWKVVAHTHSVATLVHAVASEGRAVAKAKLAGLPVAFAPYRKPGLPLTTAIKAAITGETQVVVLQNHGLICAAASVADCDALIRDVEARLAMPVLVEPDPIQTIEPAPDGYTWAPEASMLAKHPRLKSLALAGSYWPDHVVFLGPALPTSTESNPPAILVPDVGVALKVDATSAQKAMVMCLRDVLTRLPENWDPEAIGGEAEAELLNWDAEKYRQALAARQS